MQSETYATTAFIAVPESRLVTSVLLRIRHVTSAVTVLSIDSPFLMLRAPLSILTSVCSNVLRGKCALHLPHLLLKQPVTGWCLLTMSLFLYFIFFFSYCLIPPVHL